MAAPSRLWLWIAMLAAGCGGESVRHGRPSAGSGEMGAGGATGSSQGGAAATVGDGAAPTTGGDGATSGAFFERGGWHVEDASGGVQHLRSGEAAELGGQRFVFHSPGPVPETPQALTPVARRELTHARVRILVASDEETAGLQLEIANENLSLSARTHLYLLAYLGRLRQRASVHEADGGWVGVERACHELRVDPEALAVLVYRCRRDFETLRFQDASRVIERTRGLLRIGLEPEQFSVRLHDGGS
jgi:hypothetical protein